MPRPLYETNVHTRLRSTERGVDSLYKRGPGPWVVPTLLNGFAAPGDPRFGVIAYRSGAHGELEFDGFLDVSSATSGAVAFILGAYYIPTTDADLLTSVRNSSTFSAAMLSINRDNGEVTVTWPIT